MNLGLVELLKCNTAISYLALKLHFSMHILPFDVLKKEKSSFQGSHLDPNILYISAGRVLAS